MHIQVCAAPQLIQQRQKFLCCAEGVILSVLPDRVEVKRLEVTLESKKHLQDKLQEKMTPLIEEREAFLLDYQWQKLYAELNPDKQEIYNHLAKLEKENRRQGQSVQDDLARVRCQRALDTVSWSNFQEIVKEARPEQAQALIERYERERERERMRAFQRGRS
jgi:hypothetical protein